MKVRALTTIFYIDVRFRGDDTLGEGKGDILTLVDRDVTESDPRMGKPLYDAETGEVKKRRLTAEEQFSPKSMERMPDDCEDRVTCAQDALSLANHEITESKRPKQRARA